MAEKKSAPAPSSSYTAIEIILGAIAFVSLAKIATNWFAKNKEALTSFFNSLLFNLVNLYARYVIFSIFLTLVLFILLIIYSRREREIRNKLMSRVLPTGGEKEASSSVAMENPKWKLVEAHINSDDANKWKLAIIEADIILGELLDSLQLHGQGIGEQLKNVEASDFDNLEQAWEAHKIRNAIAHQGSDFLLTQREAKRVIELYKSVFDEFKII